MTALCISQFNISRQCRKNDTVGAHLKCNAGLYHWCLDVDMSSYSRHTGAEGMTEEPQSGGEFLTCV